VNVIVSDTSPLQYLLQCGKIELLPQLFGRVIIPLAVVTEIEHPSAPVEVRQWLGNRPAWLELRRVISAAPIRGLDAGEAEALQLAEELKADAILLDDGPARLEARRRGLRLLGTLGVIELAARKGLVAFDAVVDRLQKTNIFLATNLIEEARARVHAATRQSFP
jgi:predicted nucleic acid-binding protein